MEKPYLKKPKKKKTKKPKKTLLLSVEIKGMCHHTQHLFS
jgi:hypothetical protein